MTAPRCWNRDPAPLVRIRHGIDECTGGPIRTVIDDGWSKPGCRTWDGVGIGSNNERYPVAHGWADYCKTCRWLPAFAKKELGL